MPPGPTVTLLSGGGGGAKLAEGLARAVEDLTVVANTGDDAVIYGLSISPDLDTVMYTLAGMIDTEKGWGVDGDTFATLGALGRLGMDTWFTLGDQDLATHVRRTALLRAGARLSEVTAELTAALGVRARLLPMTDDRVATLVETDAGLLPFQEYFVARRHRDAVRSVVLDGVEAARPAPGVLEALTADVVVLGPSNPFLSIGPILAVPGVREALAATPARRVAVSPIVAGQALKGPAAAMLAALGHEVSALGVARLYEGLLDVLVVDEADAALAPAIRTLGMDVVVTRTVLGGAEDRERLARELLAAA
ncbi:2-phospho-L-lactate transferase [Georgenia thermotolerans]|uniref:2-phospho-L-lactate transferase n=1 Tax=Georgenia thermotolerans TaxID=527326 RepID=A0A7J5UT67_9MICO|nr:2-phospho-L-lactate transferase [Georgenia thermotolerans]KAE8765481.1 2-phospho-L-lactate transferase [Georgenia thermotolerans]